MHDLLALVAAAKYLKTHEAELQGTVRLLFQPAEEGGAGAKLMVDEGAMQGVSAVFGLHVWPTAPSGVVETRVRRFGLTSLKIKKFGSLFKQGMAYHMGMHADCKLHFGVSSCSNSMCDDLCHKAQLQEQTCCTFCLFEVLQCRIYMLPLLLCL